MRYPIHALLLFGATMLAVVTPCAAQFEITPFVGAYLPGNDYGSKLA
jgi:hypothetical protein